MASPAAEIEAVPLLGWPSTRSSDTSSPSGSMPKLSKGMRTVSPESTRPVSMRGNGFWFSPSGVTVTVTAAVSLSSGDPAIEIEYRSS